MKIKTIIRVERIKKTITQVYNEKTSDIFGDEFINQNKRSVSHAILYKLGFYVSDVAISLNSYLNST